MKICVITPRYMVSGVALAQHRFARALGAAGHQVDFMIGRVDPHLSVPASPGVKVIAVDLPKVRHMFVPLWHYLRRSRPDIIFSAEDHLNALVLVTAVLARSKARISGSSRVRPFDTYSNRPLTKRWLLKHLMRMMFWRADALTCVSRDMVGQYRQVFKSPPHVCVYNIVDDAASRAKMTEAVGEPWLEHKELPVLVAAGTLAPWKGFADLVEAIGILDGKGVELRLIILGEGPLRGELEAQIDRLGLRHVIKLPGFTDNPLKYFSRADAFVLSSQVEGLPNVLVEAMMCGCTPVSTDCPTGPREVLGDGQFGYLVPVSDPVSLAAGIEQALNHPIAPNILAGAVRPFEESVIITHHFGLLGLDPNG